MDGIRKRPLRSPTYRSPTHGLPLDVEAIRRLCGKSLGGLVNRALGEVDDDQDLDEADRDEAVKQILAAAICRCTVRLGEGRVGRRGGCAGAACRDRSRMR